MRYLSNTEISLTKSVVSFNAACVSTRKVYLPSKNVDGREHEGFRVVSINIPRLLSWSLRLIDHHIVISFYTLHTFPD